MSTRGPSQLSSNGLIFYYDTFNEKSYLGEPTTNYSYDHNPRIDPSYSLWSPGYGGTFATKHPDAIRVYNDAGTEITSYVNTGVTDWTNTYHAIWTYDYILQRPVVTMRDVDGQWKAKYIYTGINFNSLGMTVGSKYTISWLQWTDNLSKRANVGLYTRNNSVSYNFWDGLSGGSSTSTNTLTNTWQRVYHTFTVTSNWNLSDSWNQIYMYGMEYVRGTLKIADVQFELKDHATQFSKAQARSTTTGLCDLTGNTTTNLTNAAYDSNADINFNGSNYITLSKTAAQLGLSSSSPMSVGAWVYVTSLSGYVHIVDGSGNRWHLAIESTGDGSSAYFWNGSTYHSTSSPSIITNTWVYLVGVQETSLLKLYINGVLATNGSISSAASNLIQDCTVAIGYWQGNNNRYMQGKIRSVSIHNRALTSSEILQNFNNTKSRYKY